MYELNAAGETTNDLLENLIEALRKLLTASFRDGWETKLIYGQ
jgi:hypothetical protein